MAEPIVYVIEGDPIPLARCRISRTTFRMYDSQKELKLISQITLQSQHNDRPLYEGPLLIDAHFYFKIPKSRKDIKPLDYKTSTPDTDNLIKLICDICNNLLFRDDAQVAKMLLTKQYDTYPRTEFTIIELDDDAKKKERKRKTKSTKRQADSVQIYQYLAMQEGL